MITPATRSTVSAASIAATVTLMLAVGCASARPTDGPDGAAMVEHRLGVRFDNTASTYVDVYLIGDQREWRLGRVAPGARAILRIPESALTTTSGFLRLAVLAGSSLSVNAARDPRATFTIAQPAPELFAQRWTFSATQLAAPALLGAPADRVQPLGGP